MTQPLRITFIYASAPHVVHEHLLHLPSGATVQDAIDALAATDCEWRELALSANASLGVWGRQATHRQLLRDNDRIELYRALRVDPKLARRERFTQQGSKGAGLFATRRKGAKAGY